MDNAGATVAMASNSQPTETEQDNFEMYDEQDHVLVDVNVSENEFMEVDEEMSDNGHESQPDMQEHEASVVEYLNDARSVATDASEVTFHATARKEHQQPAADPLVTLQSMPGMVHWVEQLVKSQVTQVVWQKTPPQTGKPSGLVSTNNNMIKSPSDTTVYAPALNKALAPASPVVMGHLPLPDESGSNHENRFRNEQINSSVAPDQQITQFLEQVRLEVSAANRDGNLGDEVQQQPDEVQPGTGRQEDPLQEKAWGMANQAIVNAEKFRALLNPLPGNSEMVSHVPPQPVQGSFDDEFSILPVTWILV